MTLPGPALRTARAGSRAPPPPRVLATRKSRQARSKVAPSPPPAPPHSASVPAGARGGRGGAAAPFGINRAARESKDRPGADLRRLPDARDPALPRSSMVRGERISPVRGERISPFGSPGACWACCQVEGVMHPMFVKLFMQPGEDDVLAEEEDRRRAANRARRTRSRVAIRVPARDRDRLAATVTCLRWSWPAGRRAADGTRRRDQEVGCDGNHGVRRWAGRVRGGARRP